MSEVIDLPMDAARVCNAIAKIGYSPAAAIMDIIDNSVVAGASNIGIHIERDEDKTINEKNNVTSIFIADDGRGMDDSGILDALKLGSPPNYSESSLSKYGMGLKSAGFSVAPRIEVFSKQDGKYTKLYSVDKRELKDKYVVNVMTLSGEKKEKLDRYVKGKNGTLVALIDCNEIEHEPARKTIERLQERLGVVYFEFISAKKSPLTISIFSPGINEIAIKPLDILFSSDSKNGYDKDSYDFLSPCLVFSDEIALDGIKEKMKLEVVLFPTHKMSTYPGFSKEERQQIAGYKVSRSNSGFFIYRNKRLIRWGDNLSDLIGRDTLVFRARLHVTSSMDDLLHIDVSKQRMSIPEQLRGKLDTITRNARTWAIEIQSLCTEKLKSVGGEEGSGFNTKNESVVEGDPDAEHNPELEKIARTRKKKLADETQKSELESGEAKKETTDQGVAVAEISTFEKVRYSEKVQSSSLWEPGFDPTEGNFVRINKNHDFYKTVLSSLEDSEPARQAIEALLWASACAENLTFEHLSDVDEETIRKVLIKFKRVLSYNLETWCGRNRDLF